MERLKKEWIENWTVDDVIGNAISLGIEYRARQQDSDTAILKDNKNLLVQHIDYLIKGAVFKNGGWVKEERNKNV